MAVKYMQRSRDYYRAQGYQRDYEWAHHTDAPFTPLTKPLSECTVGIVTTARPLDAAGAQDVLARPTDPPPVELFTDNRFWDKDATHTHDLDSYCPINRMHELVVAGRVGALAERFYFVPTDYSQRRTREVDAPRVLELCREDAVDVMLLIPL